MQSVLEKNDSHRPSSTIWRVLVYLTHAQGKKMLYVYRTNKGTSHGQGKKISHRLDGNLEFKGKRHVSTLSGGELQMDELFCTTSVWNLRPRGHSWLEIRTPKGGAGRLFIMCLFNRKNSNQSVNIIIYLSLQWWWKNVQVSSFNKV